MAKTKSMTRNQNHDDDDDDASSSCSRKRSKTFDNCGMPPWSDLNHHVLYIVMSQLGVIDFLAFSGVCKSWRSLAVSNKEWFMASKPPMSMSFDPYSNNNEDSYCYLEDSEGRRFKTIVPHSAGRKCIGLTCGYLILYGTREFWLVNPITRHQLHFPDFPSCVATPGGGSKAVLVFSPSISRFVFVVLHRKTTFYASGRPAISFYIEGKRTWNHVASKDTIPILDLHVFKGKIYTLHIDCTLCELRLNLNQRRKWTLLETQTLPNPNFTKNPDLTTPLLASSNESLFVISNCYSPQKALKLDFGKMKWVSPEKTIREYAFFIGVFYFGGFDSCAAIKPESCADIQTRYKRYEYFLDGHRDEQCILYKARRWYFPHDCLNVSDLV